MTALCRRLVFRAPWVPSTPWPRLSSVPLARPPAAPILSPPHGPSNPGSTSVRPSPLGLCLLCSPSAWARRRWGPARPALTGSCLEAPGDWQSQWMDPSGFCLKSHLHRLEDPSPPVTFLLLAFAPFPATSALICWGRPWVPGPAAGRLLSLPVWDSACPSPAAPASWALQTSCPVPARPGQGNSLVRPPHRVPWPSEGLMRPQEPRHPGQGAAQRQGWGCSAPALVSLSQVPCGISSQGAGTPGAEERAAWEHPCAARVSWLCGGSGLARSGRRLCTLRRSRAACWRPGPPGGYFLGTRASVGCPAY